MKNLPVKSKQKGQLGENLAKKLLNNLGYKFVTQNFQTRYGEIDLIFRDHDEVVFVEVKARKSMMHGLPQEAVTPSKLAKITKTAQQFLVKKGWTNFPARIDVVAVDLGKNPPKMEHIKNVSQ